MLPDSCSRGLDIILKYDPQAAIFQEGNIIQVIVDDTCSTFQPADEDTLLSLGWEYEDREVWLYDLNGDNNGHSDDD